MKSSHSLLLSRPIVIMGLIVGFILGAGGAVLSTVSTREVASASLRAANTQDTLLEINQLLSSLIDAETGQRGYILTGMDSYLEPYTRANARLNEQLVRLAERFEYAPAQQAILERISSLVSGKKAELSRTIELRRTHEASGTVHLADSGDGLDTMNALRDAVRELEQNELIELAFNSEAVSQRVAFFQRIGLGMLLAACLLAGAGAVLLMRRTRELEKLITVCAWTKRVKFNGAWVSFEDYLKARFNLQFTHGISEEAVTKLESEKADPAPATPPRPKTRPGFTPPIKDPSEQNPTIKHA